MARAAKISVKDRNPVVSFQDFLKTLMATGQVTAILVAQHLSGKSSVMPTLVSDPEKLGQADPFAPAFPMNAARLLARLTRKPMGGLIAAVLRPCEIRAFIELVKLKQGSLDEVLLIGADCPGAFGNIDYSRYAGSGGIESTLKFCADLPGHAETDGVGLSPACKACEYPVAENADLTVCTFGTDMFDSMMIKANTPQGEEVLEKMKLPEESLPASRDEAVAAVVAARTAYRDRMFEETSDATADIEKLMGYLSNCVNCYNCRVACPVCYCRECVFLTDVFDHEPAQYLRWAKRKGVIKMPTDTVFFHLTRLAHMSTACIGCGQCSNACPNNVPVMELFRTIAHYTQRAFQYTPGASLQEEPPLSVFREREFPEVTGGKE